MQGDNWLTEKYPFIRKFNIYTGKPIKTKDGKPEQTLLDDLPIGWVSAFGLELCYDLREALIQTDTLDSYQVMQAKEKFGELRWYDVGGNPETDDIIKRYTEKSRRTCVRCGRPAYYKTTGWVQPYCEKCIQKLPSWPNEVEEIPSEFTPLPF